MINLSILVIGHQIPTKYGGYIDVLGVDVEVRIHVIELKRDRTPREVVAQILDYGSWAQDLSLSEVTELYAEHQGGALDEAFVETFGSAVPDTFNADQRLTIVASELDAASDRIVTFLASRHDVPINAVFFRYFVDGESEYWLGHGFDLQKRQKQVDRGSQGRSGRGTVATTTSSWGGWTGITGGRCAASTASSAPAAELPTRSLYAT